MSQNQIKNLSSSSFGNDDSGGGESSWTPYFVDFVINNQQSYSGSYQSSPSNVSYNDNSASSSLPKRFNNYYETRKCKKLNFNRRKTQQYSLVDEDLEDTASSPNNSPKVCGLRKTDIYPRKEEKLDRYSMEKTVSAGTHEHEKGFAGKEHESILYQW